MYTFAQKPKVTQKTNSTKSTIPCQSHFGQSPDVRSILHLQRTIGNKALQRMLQADDKESEVGLSKTASAYFGHDFSRISLNANVQAQSQTKISPILQTKKNPQPTYVEGGGATPGKGYGVDIVFIIQYSEDAFSENVKKYIQNTLTGQEYYMVNDLHDLFFRLNLIATGGKSQYVPSIKDEMELTPEEIRSRDIEIPARTVRRIRLVAHGQSGIGGVKMGAYGENKEFVSPDKIKEYAKQPHIQKIVKNALTPDAVVEFWGCNIGAIPEAGEAWSSLFQTKFKATGDTFKTGVDKFYRHPDPGEQGEFVDGIKDKVVQVVNSSEVYSRNKNLITSFESWLLIRYTELVTNGDILPEKDSKDQLVLMKDIFDKSKGDINHIVIERKSDSKLIRPGDKKNWNKLWEEFSPVKIGESK